MTLQIPTYPLSPLLFVLAVDCLGRLMDAAQVHVVLTPLGSQVVKHGASIYADDVIVFSKPLHSDITAVARILELFGNATALRTNMLKRRLYPPSVITLIYRTFKLRWVVKWLAFPVPIFACHFQT